MWCYTGSGNVRRWFPRKHDSILFHSKGDEYTFNPDNVRIRHQSGLHNDGTVFGKRDGDASLVRQAEQKGKLVEDWWADIGAGAHISGDCQKFRVLGAIGLESKRRTEHGETHTRSTTVPR